MRQIPVSKTSKALVKQLEYILVNHSTIDIEYRTYAEGDFDMLQKFDLTIVDEADLFIRKFGASFRQEKQLTVLQGLIHLKTGPVLFCSATFSKLEERVLDRLLNCPQSNWFTYESVLEVLQRQKINPDITVAEMKGDFEQSLQTLFKGKM